MKWWIIHLGTICAQIGMINSSAFEYGNSLQKIAGITPPVD